MRYKRQGSNQHVRKTNVHYIYYWAYMIIFFIVMSYILPDKTANAQIISPVATSTKLTPVEASNSASLVVETIDPGQEKLELQNTVEEYIKTIFGKDAKTAVAVSRNECGPTNKAYPKCVYHTEHEYSVGVFQINLYNKNHLIHAAKVPGETMEEKIESLKDPFINTLVAYKIYSHSGFQPWSAYTNGNYLKDM